MNAPVRVALISFVFAVVGCDPVIPRDPAPPERVIAEFDPAGVPPVVPEPNSMAISTSTGLWVFNDPPQATTAERAFNRYLRTLDGAPLDAVARHRFSDAIDPATVTAATVRVFDITDPAAVTEVVDGVTRTWNEASRMVEVRAPWQAARRYGVAVLSGPDGVRGANGREVIGSPAFALIRAGGSLVTCTDLSSHACEPSTSLIHREHADDAREAAVTLERARLHMQPLMTHLEANGIARTSLAAAWTFPTVSQPLATFDPTNGIIPFPNDLLMKDGYVNLPIDPEDDAITVELKAGLNGLNGFSTTAALLTETGAGVGAANQRLDASSVEAKHFRLINLYTQEEHPITVECRSCGSATTAPGDEPDQIAIRPAHPLRPMTAYALVWQRGTRSLTTGQPVNANANFALLRLETPLHERGKSTLSFLDDATARKLEPLRESMQNAIWAASTKGLLREQVAMAWTFQTQSNGYELVNLVSSASFWNLPSNVTGGPSNLTEVDLTMLSQLSAFTGQDFHSKILWAKEGTIVTGNALEANATEPGPDGSTVTTLGAFTAAGLAVPRQEQLRFLLVAPKGNGAAGPTRVVFFQHGLGRTRRDALFIANTLARHGYATLAIDAPMHGQRSFCTADAECSTGTQCVDHTCPGGYAIGPGPLPNTTDPTETPLISGRGFFSSNPFFTRDHFRQQVLDLTLLFRALQNMAQGIGAISIDDPSTTEFESLRTDSVDFIGQSLGAMIGTLATATIMELSSSTLNVPGSSPVDMVLLAPAFEEQRNALDAALASRGIVKGSQKYEEHLDLMRWALDPADPRNFGRNLVLEPLVWSPQGGRKRVFVSWIEDDAIVPNATTQWLIDSISAPPDPMSFLTSHFKQVKYTGGNHAFLLDATNPGLCLSAQEDAVSWLRAP